MLAATVQPSDKGLVACLQGRSTTDFDDRNEDLLQLLAAQHPSALSLEMESFHLFDLARCSGGSIQAAAVAIVLAERQSNAFIAAEKIVELEKRGGLAALQALVAARLPTD